MYTCLKSDVGILVETQPRNTFLKIFLLFGYSFRNFLDASQPYKGRRRSFRTLTKQRRRRFFLLLKHCHTCLQRTAKKKQKQEQMDQSQEKQKSYHGKGVSSGTLKLDWMKTIWKVWARGNDAPLHMSVGVTKCLLAPAQMMALAGQFVVINGIR